MIIIILIQIKNYKNENNGTVKNNHNNLLIKLWNVPIFLYDKLIS